MTQNQGPSKRRKIDDSLLQIETTTHHTPLILLLPPEIHLKIIEYLHIHDIFSHLHTCQEFFKYWKNEKLWKRLLERDFPYAPKDTQNARQTYYDKHLIEENWFQENASRWNVKFPHSVNCYSLLPSGQFIAGCFNGSVFVTSLSDILTPKTKSQKDPKTPHNTKHTDKSQGEISTVFVSTWQTLLAGDHNWGSVKSLLVLSCQTLVLISFHESNHIGLYRLERGSSRILTLYGLSTKPHSLIESQGYVIAGGNGELCWWKIESSWRTVPSSIEVFPTYSVTGPFGAVYVLFESISSQGVPEVITGAGDGNIRIWSQSVIPSETKWNCQQILEGHSGGILCGLERSSNEETSQKRLLVTGSADWSLRVWGVSNQSQNLEDLAVLTGHGAEVLCVILVREDLCASGGQDGSILLWRLDPLEQAPIRKLCQGSSQVKDLTAIEGTKILATWKFETEIALWHPLHDRETRFQSASFQGLARAVQAFPEFLLFVCGSSQKTISLWKFFD